ncbi:MAG: FAD-dependent oxidoreductase [Anaerolineae bacterium]|nr:FAD-dependent oxidoreductase [Anaerolineae bacterium]
MQTITEPSRQIPVVDEIDVLVAGGGPAGIAAAVAAARLGVRVMLVERYGYLGGLASGGLVLYMDLLFDRHGDRYIGGMGWEMMEQLRAIGGLAQDSPTRLHADSELFKVIADKLCIEAGVKLRLHSWAVDTITEDGVVKGVLLEGKSGRQAVLSRVCVDATGDGDIAAFAGAGYDFGAMRIGLNLKVGGVDLVKFRAFQQAEPERAKVLRTEVVQAGGYPLDVGSTPHRDLGVYWVNIRGLAQRDETSEYDLTHHGFEGTLSAVDVEDLTYAEVELRKRLKVALDFYRDHVPGYENVRLLAIASQLGVRDSRRIRGLHTLCQADAESGILFEDVVGTMGATYAEHYHLQVPYRSLVPQTLDGLLTSGRCISVDEKLIHALRLIPPCMVTGQAAGTAAALSVKANLAPRELNVVALQKQLVADGVILPNSVDRNLNGFSHPEIAEAITKNTNL